MDESRDLYTYIRTGHARVGPQQEWLPGQLEVDVWVLGRVSRYRAVEGLVAQIAPRADGIRVDVNFEGEPGHLGFFGSRGSCSCSCCRARRLASALLSVVLESGAQSFWQRSGTRRLVRKQNNSQWARQKRGVWTPKRHRSLISGGSGGGDTAPSRKQLLNSTTTCLGTVYPPTIQIARCPVAGRYAQDMRREMRSEGESLPLSPLGEEKSRVGISD